MPRRTLGEVLRTIVLTTPFEASRSAVALSDGGASFACEVLSLCLGRRPTHLRSARAAGAPAAVGDLFAEAARLEAASVHAFRVLASDLRAHKAPEHLCTAARRSAADEARHARTMRSLAHRHGTAPRWPEVGQPRARTLAAVAVENAVEGCAREAYGAAVALWQAGHAQDTAVARALADIAEDEVRHAELAWELHAWFLPRLLEEEREEVREARRAALEELLAQTRREVPAELVAVAGLPSAAVARRLVQRLTAELG